MRSLRKRKVRFPLIMDDDRRIRRLDDLKKYGNPQKILSYYANGKLECWLRDRYYDKKADEIKNLEKNQDNLAEEIMKILGIESSVSNILLSQAEKQNEKKDRVRKLTDKKELIEQSDNFAFDDDEFNELMMDKSVEVIYLYSESGEVFHFKAINHPVKLIGYNYVTIDMDIFNFNDLKNEAVVIDNIKLTSDKLEKIKAITSDSDIIGNFEKVAIDAEMCKNMIISGNEHLYLLNGRFKIDDIFPTLDSDVTIIGVKDVTIDLEEYCFNDIKAKFENVTFTSEKLDKVKALTTDSNLVKNFEKVAIDADMCKNMIISGNEYLYLLKGKYKIDDILPSLDVDVTIVGIQGVNIDLEKYCFNEIKAKFENVIFTSEKLDKVKALTSDKKIIANFEKVILTDVELCHAMRKKEESLIYLYGEKFTVPLIGENKQIVRLGKTIVTLEQGKKYSEYQLRNISFLNTINYGNTLEIGDIICHGSYNDISLKWKVFSKDKYSISIIATEPLNSDIISRVCFYRDFQLKTILSSWYDRISEKEIKKAINVRLLNTSEYINYSNSGVFKDLIDMRINGEYYIENDRAVRLFHRTNHSIYPVLDFVTKQLY